MGDGDLHFFEFYVMLFPDLVMLKHCVVPDKDHQMQENWEMTS